MEKADVFLPAWERPIRIPQDVPIEHSEPPFALAGETGTWLLRFRFSCDVPAGAPLKLQTSGGRNNRGGFEPPPQVERPDGAGYTTARTQDGAPVELKSDGTPGTLGVTVPASGFARNTVLNVTIGDRSSGGPGIKAGTSRRLNKFFVLYWPERGGASAGAWSDPNWLQSHSSNKPGTWSGDNMRWIVAACTMHLLGGRLNHLHAWAPSQASPDEDVAILARPEDEFHNVSSERLGEAVALLGSHKLHAECHVVDASTCLRLKVRLGRQGTLRVVVRHPSSGIEAVTNPIVCSEKAPALRAWWGMIHGHSEMSDGSDTLDDYFHQLRNECALDFGAPGDHDHLWETSDRMWKTTCDKVKKWHAEGRFVTFLGYEWAKWRKNGDGDRNVYYLEDDRPMYRSDNGEYPTPPDLFRAIRDEKALVIPHHTAHAGNFCDYKDHDPTHERLIEIYQVRGSYECAAEDGNPRPEHYPQPPYADGYVRRALALGWRVGFTAGGDDHNGTAGTGKSKDGLMCVLAPENTRVALWDGMWQRRVVATTGARLLLFYELNGHPMGAELNAKADPRLSEHREFRIEFHGTSPASQIDVIRNNVVVHSEQPHALDCVLEWTDEIPLKEALMQPARFCDHPFCFYYVRVMQEDGEMGWASPVWIDPCT
jgi:hypothetical protein